jgi:hypothetical protein
MNDLVVISSYRKIIEKCRFCCFLCEKSAIINIRKKVVVLCLFSGRKGGQSEKT